MLGVRACRDACQVWSRSYDGSRSDARPKDPTENGPTKSLHANQHASAISAHSESNRSSPNASSRPGYHHLNGANGDHVAGSGGGTLNHNGKTAEEREDSGIFVNDQKVRNVINLVIRNDD